MKAFKHFVKSIGGGYNYGNSKSSSSTSKVDPASLPFIIFAKKRRSSSTGENGTCATDDTSNSSLTSENMGPVSDAPWRVEKIRSGAPGEQDWWKDQGEEEMDITTEEEGTNASSTGWLAGSSGGLSESMEESVNEADKSTSTDGGGTGPRKFHNCGLETWEVARARWNARPTGSDPSKKNSSNNSRAPVNSKELGKILTKASTLRTYELPRRVPLNNLVESYVNVWNGDEL